MYHNLPGELRQLIQWVVWRYEEAGGGKPTKVPYNPTTGRHASTTDPATWVSYEHATQALWRSPGVYAGIGFVFTERDDYCGIDLDTPKDEDGEPIFDPETQARQHAIFEAFNTYSERSPSGLGLHLICKGKVPHGRKRAAIEIYSSGRFFTMTGDVFHDAPIAPRQELVDLLWSEMGPAAEPNYYMGDVTENKADHEIFEAASKAKNGDLFTRLWNGDWSGYQPNNNGDGSSEADFALIDIIAYYTKHRMQIQRMFLSSALGRRPKYANANPNRLATLVGYMVNKSFDRMLPPIDLSGVIDQVNAALASVSAQAGHAAPSADLQAAIEPKRAVGADLSPATPYTFDGFDTTIWRRIAPPGLIGVLTDFIFNASPRPVYEIALAGALGLMSGICGRAFNVSGTGLNHYVMLLAATGTGKEAMASGISKAVAAVAEEVKSIREFIGPSEIASGQALLKHLTDRPTPSFVSVTGEFGLRLQQISDPRANSSEVALRRVMLDLFNKSGSGQSVQPTIYSDKKNNTGVIHSPNFSLLGESTPETFYRALDEDSVTQGLLPRFTIIEYTGLRVALNQGHNEVEPPYVLKQALGMIARNVHENMNAGRVTLVATQPDALDLLNKVDVYADGKINTADRDILKQLWNRLHIKTYKLAGLLAVGQDFYAPVITLQMVEWALSLVITDTMRLLDKFVSGEMGAHNEETAQTEAIRKAIKHYLTCDYSAIASYKTPGAMHGDKVIPHSFIQRKCVSMAAFRHDRRGATNALNQTIKQMVDIGTLREVPTPQLREKYQFEGKSYSPFDLDWLLK